MHIGVDFDNTIVCYDRLFHRIAVEQKLIPPGLPPSKSEVRNYLRDAGREELWTEMQGYVYGARMNEAEPYPGVLDFFRACRKAAIPLSIISHKTRHPYLGKQYDLHEAALGWLTQQGFFDPQRIGMPREEVFLELTKEAKLRRIGQRGCTHFIDDLPEFLTERSFPNHVKGLLFDPNRHYTDSPDYLRAESWDNILSALCPATTSGSH